MRFATTLTWCGSPGRTRTADLMINSHPLYRLSYRGIKANLKWILACGQVTRDKKSSFMPAGQIALSDPMHLAEFPY